MEKEKKDEEMNKEEGKGKGEREECEGGWIQVGKEGRRKRRITGRMKIIGRYIKKNRRRQNSYVSLLLPRFYRPVNRHFALCHRNKSRDEVATIIYT